MRADQQNLGQCEVEWSAAKETLTKLDKARAAARESVGDYARGCGLAKPVSPAVFAEWIEKRDLAARADENWKRLQKDHAATLSDAKQLIAELQDAMRLESQDFDILVNEARALQGKERSREERRSKALEACNSLKAELNRKTETLERLQEDRSTNKRDWDTLIDELFGAVLSRDVVIQSLEPLRTLREIEGRRLGADRQVKAMEKDQKDFAGAVARLVEMVGIKTSAKPLEAFKTLQDAASDAEEAFKELTSALKEKEELLGATCEVLKISSEKRLTWRRCFHRGYLPAHCRS